MEATMIEIIKITTLIGIFCCLIAGIIIGFFMFLAFMIRFLNKNLLN